MWPLRFGVGFNGKSSLVLCYQGVRRGSIGMAYPLRQGEWVASRGDERAFDSVAPSWRSVTIPMPPQNFRTASGSDRSAERKGGFHWALVANLWSLCELLAIEDNLLGSTQVQYQFNLFFDNFRLSHPSHTLLTTAEPAFFWIDDVKTIFPQHLQIAGHRGSFPHVAVHGRC